MAGPLGDLGQGQADHPQPFGKVSSFVAHPAIVPPDPPLRCGS
jgi:hypothetical protein